MPYDTSLHHFLIENAWKLEEINKFLELDHSSINQQDYRGATPLFRVLRNENCTVDIVRVLFRYGADVNLKDKSDRSPLLIALQHRRDEAIVAELLKQGADVDIHDGDEQSPLHLVFKNFNSRNPNWKENVLNLLFKAGVDLNNLNTDGESPFCFALWEGASVGDIELLLEKGAKLNACKKHSSPLLCAVKDYSEMLLKADVVNFLLKKGARVDEVTERGYNVVQCALKYSRYEIFAMEMLLDLPGVDVKYILHERKGNLLHFAMHNKFCNPYIVNLLIDRGVRLDQQNVLGETPLFLAMKMNRLEPTIFEILVKNGSPLNAKDNNGITILYVAIYVDVNCDINALLASGAKFVCSSQPSISILEVALCRYRKLGSQSRLDKIAIILKYCFLEDAEFRILAMIQNFNDRFGMLKLPLRSFNRKHGLLFEDQDQYLNDREHALLFEDQCLHELKRMESVNLNSGCTLRKFVSGYFPGNIGTDYEPEVTYCNFNQLSRAISGIEFPCYIDIIVAKVGRLTLKTELKKICVCTVKQSPNSNCTEKKMALIYECVCEVAQYLPDKDLFRLILAFYNAGHQSQIGNYTEGKLEL